MDARGLHADWSRVCQPIYRRDLVTAALQVFKIHEPISKALDIPPIIVQFVVGMLMMCGFVGAMIGFAVWLGPKKSRDEDEHED